MTTDTLTAAVLTGAPPRLLVAGTTDLDGHLRHHGPMPELDGRHIRAMVAASGLAGRGGAGFPAYRKLEAVASAGRAIVIGNAAEGEPASRKDRALLHHAPHLVIDGLLAAARATGADEAHLYVPGAAAGDVAAAIAARRDRMPVAVHIAPDTFVAGEESAVVAAVGGGRAVPTDKGVRVVQRGLHGRPTLVHNVETLAHLALIVRRGPAWFRDRGTDADPGTFLASVSGPVGSPGVYEAPYGIRLGDLLGLAGGATEPLRAVLVGGYHGAWVPPDPGLPVDRAHLARFDASPGAGVVIALPTRTCGLVATARVVRYLAGQQAGRCGPCVNGLPRIADTVEALARPGSHPGMPAEVERLSRLVVGRGACRHPDGTVRLVRSALRSFAPEVAAHLSGRCTVAGGAS